MSREEDTPTPTPILEESPKPSTDKSDPKTITDRFTIIDKIGVGGMGRVYSALDSRLNRTVAIKILSHDDFSQNQWMRFQREAKAASKLSHPNIVQVLDFGQSKQNQPFLIMEYIEGETLTEYLQTNGPLPETEALNIISDLCSAMEQAHSKNIIHRDLKPANIIISNDQQNPRFMILDFGIAKVEEDNQGVKTLTKTGQIVGSPRCISPEQAIGDKIDGRADIYSLGCIAYELLAGNPVFQGNTSFSVIEKHIGSKTPKLCDSNQIIYSDAVENLIAKALEKEPQDRFQSMSEFQQACQEALVVDIDDSTQAKISTTNNDSSTTKRMFYLATTCGAIILVTLAISFGQELQPRDNVGKKSKTTRSSTKVSNTQTKAQSSQLKKYPENKHLQSQQKVQESTILKFNSELDSLGVPKSYTQNNTFKNTITASNSQIVEQLSKGFRKNSNATTIVLKDCTVDNSSIKALKAFKKLFYLELQSCKIELQDLDTMLSKLPISKFGIQGSITTEELKVIIKKKAIKYLVLKYTALSNNKLKLLASMKHLDTLDISGNPKISLEGLKPFRPNKSLIIKYNYENKLLPINLNTIVRRKNLIFREELRKTRY